MTRLLKGCMAAAVLLSLMAGSASAELGESPSVGFYLTNGSVIDFHYMGFGVDFSVPFRGNRWAWTGGFDYDFGNFKVEDTSTPSSGEFKQTLSGYNARLGIDRQVNVGPALFYCGSGLFYSSHKYKEEFTGAPDFTSDQYKVIGLSNRMGSRVPLSSNPNIELFGQFNNTVGFASADNIYASDTKLTQTDVNNGAEMGLRVNFGATTQ
jgi:hypothetical protein